MKRIGFLWSGLALLGVGAAVLYLWARVPGASPSASPEVVQASPPAEAAQSEQDSEPREVLASEKPETSGPPAVVHSPAREQPVSVASGLVSPEAQELVAKLTQFDLGGGPITEAKARQWKQWLKDLAAEGPSAIPAIQEFLDRNEDLNLAALPGGNLLGESSLCVALLKTLAQIGGPEVQTVMAQTLKTACNPSEIGFVASYLDAQAPGQYREEAVNAANQVLAMAANGQLPNWDVGPLFQVLQA